MAEFSLPPPAPFLPVPGEPPIPWASWIDGFTVYLEAMDYVDIPDRRKIALLRHCLGAEGQRIYRALGEAETYEPRQHMYVWPTSAQYRNVGLYT